MNHNCTDAARKARGTQMPATGRYTTINGEIITEKRNGVRSLYVPDPVGSTVALLDNTQTQTDQWSYMPYGESTRIKGTNPTPFLFGGTLGMRADSTTRTYARTQVVEPPNGRWMTSKRAGFRGGDLNRYAYANDSPVNQGSFSGLMEYSPPSRGTIPPPRKPRPDGPHLLPLCPKPPTY